MVTFTETPVDAADAQELLNQYLEYRTRTFPRPGRYRAAPADAADFVRPRGVFLVVSDGETPIGCGGVRLLDAGRAEVKHLWVRPARQGQGTGRLLLAELERIAAELGARAVVLDTHSCLASAAATYRTQGYRPITPYNENPNADTWLGKTLPPRAG